MKPPGFRRWVGRWQIVITPKGERRWSRDYVGSFVDSTIPISGTTAIYTHHGPRPGDWMEDDEFVASLKEREAA